MAYIYAFDFLCGNIVDANRILYLLGQETYPGLGGCLAKIGGQECHVNVHHHSFITGEVTSDSSLYWVSVIPYESDRPKWQSGGFSSKKEKREAKKFENAILSRMEGWLPEVDFIYAAPGFEVAGFRNDKEILELLKDYPPHLSYINKQTWERAGRPNNWGFVNLNILQCYPPYESRHGL